MGRRSKPRQDGNRFHHTSLRHLRPKPNLPALIAAELGMNTTPCADRIGESMSGRPRKRDFPLGEALDLARQGMKVPAIASRLNIPIATVYRKLNEERDKILKQIADREYLQDVPDPAEWFSVRLTREYGGGECGTIEDHTATVAIKKAEK